jgi:hypothetical protein
MSRDVSAHPRKPTGWLRAAYSMLKGRSGAAEDTGAERGVTGPGSWAVGSRFEEARPP